MKKLVFLTNIPTPYRIVFLNALYKELLKHDIDLFVLFCAETEPNRHWKIPSTEYKFPYKIMKGFHFSVKKAYPHFNPTVGLEINKLKPTWLLIGGAWNTPTMLMAATKIWNNKMKLLFWNEGHADAVIYSKGIIPKLKKIFLSVYDAFVVPNLKSENFLIEFLKTKKQFLRLPNTVNEDFFSTSEIEKNIARESSQISKEKTVFVQVAQLEDKKGVVELVDAFASITTELKNKIYLVIIGTGTLKDMLEQKIQSYNCNNILLTGHLQATELKKWLQIADVFILATKFDPNPLSPIEASFMKLPIILSKKAGNCDEILNGKNGIQIFNITIPEIKAAIIVMAEKDKNKLKELGENSYANALKNFKTQAVCEHFISQLKSL